MSSAAAPDPFTDLLRTTPRGAATVLALSVRSRLHAAPSLSLGFLKMILLTMLVPAEALARRVILTLAATLRAPKRQQRRAPQATAPVTPPPPKPQDRADRTASFRMQEPLPRAPPCPHRN